MKVYYLVKGRTSSGFPFRRGTKHRTEAKAREEARKLRKRYRIGKDRELWKTRVIKVTEETLT